MVTWQEEITEDMLTQLATYPGVMAYRGNAETGTVHIAVRWQRKSLCGLEMPQQTWRPENTDILCGNCRRVLRTWGLSTVTR